jgi:Holliday junction resolvase
MIRRVLEKSFPGGYWRKIHGGMFQAGLPDLVGCVEGLFFGFEVKMDNEDATELQKEELEAIRDGGGIAVGAIKPSSS